MKMRCFLMLTGFLAWAGLAQAREPEFVDFRNQAKREVEIVVFDAYTKQAVSGACVQYSYRQKISFVRPLAIAEWQSTKIQKDSAYMQGDGKATISYKGIKDSFAVRQITAEGYRNYTGPFPTLRENRKATIKVFLIPDFEVLANLPTNEREKLFHDTNDDLAFAALISACHYCTGTAQSAGVKELLRIAGDSQSPNFLKSLDSLGSLMMKPYAPQVVPLLIRLLQSSSPIVLEKTIAACGAYPQTEESILPFLENSSGPVLYKTVLALRAMGSAKSLSPLRRLADSTKDAAARRYALEAMEAIQKPRLP